MLWTLIQRASSHWIIQNTTARLSAFIKSNQSNKWNQVQKNSRFRGFPDIVFDYPSAPKSSSLVALGRRCFFSSQSVQVQKKSCDIMANSKWCDVPYFLVRRTMHDFDAWEGKKHNLYYIQELQKNAGNCIYSHSKRSPANLGLIFVKHQAGIGTTKAKGVRRNTCNTTIMPLSQDLHPLSFIHQVFNVDRTEPKSPSCIIKSE